MQDNSSSVVIKTLPSSEERLPLFIVGDVHGCAQELSDLIRLAKKHIDKFQLVLVGDLFTKGPDPVGVYEQIHDHKALCIKGNHDWALWSIIHQLQRRSFHSLSEHTKQTLHLVRYHKRAIFDLLCNLPHAYCTEIVPFTQHPSWEARYPMTIVHAGIDPLRGLRESSERILLTARYLKWDNKGDEKKLVVVPSSSRLEALNAQNGTIPPPVERFRWHELYKGPDLIVFGHDAKQGLFRKTLPSGRPICVGIDTGCTYGNSLTGYFPELDLAIQVRAQRKYFDIKKNIILSRPGQSGTK